LIIRDYIIKEVLRTFAGVFIVLFLIILSTQFLKALALVVDGKIALEFLFSLIFLQNLDSLTLILPLTLFLSILLALSRLYKDSEMIALSACGIGPPALLKSVFLVVLSFVFLEIGLAMVLAPWANHKIQDIEEAFKSQADLELITPGQFNMADHGKRILFTEEMLDTTSLKNVFLHLDNGDSESVLASDSAHVVIDEKQDSRYIVFQNGNRYDRLVDSLEYRIIKFVNYAVLMEDKTLGRVDYDRDALSVTELLKTDSLSHTVEMQWRISQILMMIILAFLAVPLSKATPRQGRYGKMALAILLYIVYSNLLVVATNWLKKDVVSPFIGLWWVHILFLLLFMLLFSHQTGWLQRLYRN